VNNLTIKYITFVAPQSNAVSHTNRYPHPKQTMFSPSVMSDPVVPFDVHVGSWSVLVMGQLLILVSHLSIYIYYGSQWLFF